MKLVSFLVFYLVINSSNVHGLDVSPAKIAEATSKLERAKVMFDNFKQSDFVKTAMEVSKWAKPLMESIGFFSKVILAQMDTGSKELKYMKEQFKIINEKFDVVDSRFIEVKKELQWNVIKIQYSTYESAIDLLQDKIQTINDAPPVFRPFLMDQFKMTYEHTFYSANEKLYESIINSNRLFSDNLVLAARHFLNDHKPKVEKFFLGTLQLILKSLEVESYYMTAMNLNDNQEYWSSIWDKKIKEITNVMIRTSSEIESNFQSQLERDAETFSVNNYQKNNQDYLTDFYNFLTDKFPYRHWFLVVYNPIATDERHQIMVRGGLIRLRLRGHNIVVGSRDARYGGFNANGVMSILNRLPSGIRNAKTLLVNHIVPEVEKIQTIGLAAVIEWGAGVYFISRNDLRVYKKYEGGKTFNVIVMG